MNKKTLSPKALSVIDRYLHFTVENTACSVPYFNNKTVRARAALRTFIGKGNPRDIYDEVQTLIIKNHIDANSSTSESLKKLLVDNNLGIECSGFAYHVLNAETEDRGKGRIDKNIIFPDRGLFGKIRSAFRPAENCNVFTFAHEKNSVPVSTKDVLPGDIITMIGTSVDKSASAGTEKDHILVIHEVEYQDLSPAKIHYSHSIAYPEDGVYGTGIRQGIIEITDPNNSVMEGRWIEEGKEGTANKLYEKARDSRTEIRRLRWFS